MSDTPPSQPKKQVPRLLNESVEWYTPEKYIRAARKVMNGIDLDPASNEVANKIVRATRYYTKESDGLSQDWHATTIFLNPPYCKVGATSNQEIWTCKLIAEYEAGHVEQAILLVNAATETRWFKRLYTFPICFTDHRIQFNSIKGTKNGSTVGSAFVYFGANTGLFDQVFSQFGTVILPRLTPTQQLSLFMSDTKQQMEDDGDVA
jgi:DNA N-6-adenine-methyltransferase (Dam)